MGLIASRPEKPSALLAKADRARELLDDAERRGAELDATRALLPEARCRNCHAVMYQYRAPIAYVLHRCRRCGSWNELTVAA